MRSIFVQKYGGTSVGDLERIKLVAFNIKKTITGDRRGVIVVSAMNQQTDELHAMARALHPNPPSREVDMLLSTGERITMALLSIALDAVGVPSISLTGSQSGILTDEIHGNARIRRISGERITQGLDQNKIVIVAGFQGVHPGTKEITTLGRGGSDLSAVALAIALKASVCQIYKDVTGILSADPRRVRGTRLIPAITWPMMATLANAGANVLYHRAVQLAMKYEVPLEIRSSFDFNQPGTRVEGFESMEQPSVRAMAHRDQQVWIRISASQGNLAAEALTWFSQNEESPLIFRQTQNDKESVLEAVISHASSTAFVPFVVSKGWHYKLREDLSTVTLVGSGFKQGPEIFATLSRCFGSPPFLIECTDAAISVCIDSAGMEPALSALHNAFFPGA